jgi:exonuclease SbcC
MWELKTIYAENLCAFKELSYSPSKGCTTLIFGNNIDDDSQISNGSGKSALIEAIAIGITGEPLRKIKIEEIINDLADESFIKLLMTNSYENCQMTISRKLSRSSSQEITVEVTDKNGNCQPVVQPSVMEYNKYILDAIGLNKDDIYSNFILSKHKYISFLSSSDKDKKELINRFSNGVMVDEAIAALQEDMEPIRESLQKAEIDVATCTGRVSAVEEQIAREITEASEKSQKKTERIESWKLAIAGKRALIREINDEITQSNKLLDKYDTLNEKLQALESEDGDVYVSFNSVNRLLFESGLSLHGGIDYVKKFEQNQVKLSDVEKQRINLEKESLQQEKELKLAQEAHLDLLTEYDEFQKSYDFEFVEITKQIDFLMDFISKFESENRALRRKRTEVENAAADLQKQLAGVILCPKCKHKFTLSENIDIEQSEIQLRECENKIVKLLKSIEDNQKNVSDNEHKADSVRANQYALNTKKTVWSTKMTVSQTKLDELSRKSSVLKKDLQDIQDKINSIQKSLDSSRLELFDEAYEVLENAVKNQENSIRQAKENISGANGSILSYEESLKEMENVSDTELLDSLKASKKKYEDDLMRAISEQEDIQKKLNELKTQEAVFVEFKTHLANMKIDALACITNEFLEAIGSDIRILFSGYTVLKSGKIRDKISISLIRDGVDCGSFGKFSEGEKARVNLANILAMHKLTNVNCQEGKGLDLLVLDEILEAADETGLANIFEALNSLRITSLVVSHGNIAENYPHKLIVSKKNGISFIDESE